MHDSERRQIRNVLEIVEIANGAPDFAALGREVLNAVAKSLGVEKCVFILQRTGGGSPEFFCRGIEQEDADRYRTYYYSKDPLRLLSKVADHLEVSLHVRPNQTVSLREAISYNDFVGSRYYQEFFQPQGISHEIATRLEASPRVRAVIDLLRSPKQRPFSGCDIQMMDRLAPHLSRALDIIEMRRDLQLKSSALEQYEARSLDGLLLCDDQMRIVYANERGRELLASWRGGIFAEQLPDFFQGQAAPYLAAALQMPKGEAPPPLHREVHLASGSYELVLNVARHLDGLPRKTSFSVLLSRCERKGGDLRSDSCHRLGLSCRESEIVDKIFEGKTNEQISGELFVTEFTVKKHLQHVFEKLKVKSRTAVLAKINDAIAESAPVHGQKACA